MGHKPFDALLDAAHAAPDRARRIALLPEAQRLLYDEVPQTPLVYPQCYTAVHRKACGFVASPLTDLDFRGVLVP